MLVGEPLTPAMILKALEEGNALVAQAIVPPLEHLAVAIVNSIQLLDPYWLVVYGTFLNHPLVLQLLSGCISRLTNDLQAASTIRHCAIAEDAPFLGGTAVAVRRFFLGT